MSNISKPGEGALEDGEDFDGQGTSDFSNIKSVDTEELQGVVYAHKYSGASLADRVLAALNDGASIVRVAAQAAAYDWFTDVGMPHETAIEFDNPWQPINFEGSAASGDADVAVDPGHRCRVVGGAWDTSRTDWNTSDPWAWVQPSGDAKGCRMYPGKLESFEYGTRWDAGGSLGLTDNWLGTPFTRNVWRPATYEASGGFSNRSRVHIGRSIVTDFTGTPIDLLVSGGSGVEVYDSDLGGGGTAIDTDGGVTLYGTAIENVNTAIKTRSGMGSEKVRWFGPNRSYVSDSGQFDLNNPDDYVAYGEPGFERISSRKDFTPVDVAGGIEDRYEVTTGVSTTSTEIVNSPSAQDTLVWVYGVSQSSRGDRFLYRVGCTGGAVTDEQQVFKPTADTPSFSASSNNLLMSMDSGTYDVAARVEQFGRGHTIN